MSLHEIKLWRGVLNPDGVVGSQFLVDELNPLADFLNGTQGIHALTFVIATQDDCVTDNHKIGSKVKESETALNVIL